MQLDAHRMYQQVLRYNVHVCNHFCSAGACAVKLRHTRFTTSTTSTGSVHFRRPLEEDLIVNAAYPLEAVLHFNCTLRLFVSQNNVSDWSAEMPLFEHKRS